ncbi:MAG: hypothetical protein ACOY93_01010 [Bacillota bacterium]
MAAILGLGVIDIALGILVMAPLSLGLRKNEGISAAFYMLFQVCLVVGIALLILGGLMAIAS